MRYGVEVVNQGVFADPRRAVELAVAAEAAGWEALFVWDHLAFAWASSSSDAYVTLAGVAQATKRLRLGAEITPLARRRPHVIAHQLATLDLLSEGRVTFCAGLGGRPAEFERFGEDADPKVRAAKLDEGLAIVGGLWSGRPTTLSGEYYRAEDVTLAPTPVQRPRIPIWIGGDSRPALRRAARWDGWITTGVFHGEVSTSPEEIATSLAYVREHRVADEPFDVAVTGRTLGAADTSWPRELAEAGATWWLESLDPEERDPSALLARLAEGPPGAT
jgi:alkanesulfonate monooxygenase SsuD/methylene tetrahydromethanopterin reductase-like flavin-dependent oxidoreductase (luciferase family)